MTPSVLEYFKSTNFAPPCSFETRSIPGFPELKSVSIRVGDVLRYFRPKCPIDEDIISREREIVSHIVSSHEWTKLCPLFLAGVVESSPKAGLSILCGYDRCMTVMTATTACTLRLSFELHKLDRYLGGTCTETDDVNFTEKDTWLPLSKSDVARLKVKLGEGNVHRTVALFRLIPGLTLVTIGAEPRDALMVIVLDYDHFRKQQEQNIFRSEGYKQEARHENIRLASVNNADQTQREVSHQRVFRKTKRAASRPGSSF